MTLVTACSSGGSTASTAPPHTVVASPTTTATNVMSAPSGSTPTTTASSASSNQSGRAGVLSCDAVLQAAESVHPGFGPAKDVTATLNQGGGTQFLRACQISVTGHSTLPLVVEYRSEPRKSFDAEVAMARKLGTTPRTLDGTGWGEVAYEMREVNAPGYSVQAYVDGLHVSVTAPLLEQEVQSVARAEIALLN